MENKTAIESLKMGIKGLNIDDNKNEDREELKNKLFKQSVSLIDENIEEEDLENLSSLCRIIFSPNTSFNTLKSLEAQIQTSIIIERKLRQKINKQKKDDDNIILK